MNPTMDVNLPVDVRDVQLWQTVYWAEVERRIGPVFARSDTRAHAVA